jgi:serine/threonine-protein kinase
MPEALMVIETTDGLVAMIQELCLLDSMQQNELLRLLAGGLALPELSRQIRLNRWLTAFQLEQLLQGKGKQLQLGPYLLLERLGAGGMGEVFKAWHRRIERRVALKLIQRDQLADACTVERFLREARATAQLSHPNVVALHDANEEGGIHYLAMEFVEGIDLGRLLRNGPFPIPIACNFIRQAALGLQHAHERGIIHRDIKPANLLVADPLAAGHHGVRLGDASGRPTADRYAGGTVKILDMGLARVLPMHGWPDTPLTQVGALIGTVDYLAPEQARDSRCVDCRSDLYSLGCTLYHLLAGRPPFPGGLPLDKLWRHQSDDPVAITQLRHDVPHELVRTLGRLMAKRPGERFATAAEVAAALQPLARLPGVVIDPPDPVEGLAPPEDLPPDFEDAVVTRVVTPERASPMPTRVVPAPPDWPGSRQYPTFSNAPRPAEQRPGRIRTLGLAAGALVVVALAVTIVAWLLRSRPAPGPAFIEGDELADYFPADTSAVVVLKPAVLLTSPIAKKQLPGLGALLERLLPALPGLRPSQAEEVRLVWHRGNAMQPVCLVRDEFDPEPFDPDRPGSLRGRGGVFEYLGAGTDRVVYVVPAPPFLVATRSRKYAVAARQAVTESMSDRPSDSRIRNMLAEARVGRGCWFVVALDRLGPISTLEGELKDLQPVLDLGETLQGSVGVAGNQVEANLRFRARSEAHAEKLKEGLEKIRGRAEDCFVWPWPDVTIRALRRDWEPIVKLLAASDIRRSGRDVTLKAGLPSGPPPAGSPAHGSVGMPERR